MGKIIGREHEEDLDSGNWGIRKRECGVRRRREVRESHRMRMLFMVI